MEPTVLLLTLIFLVLVFSVCGKKSFRLLLSLVITMAVLVWVITPLIVGGHDPELVVAAVGLPVLACIVYLTEGFTYLSNLTIVAVAANFLLMSVFTDLAVKMAGLTGLVSTDASFLGLAGVDVQQLLIAGIMIGTLGILTEMVVTQIATVVEFNAASPAADRAEIYRQSYAVGIAHLGSIINTLFLVYAGVSFPLLIIYIGSGSSLSAALNYEPLVSEIIRMLVGVIGLIIAMPTSTLLAVRWLKLKREPKEQPSEKNDEMS